MTCFVFLKHPFFSSSHEKKSSQNFLEKLKDIHSLLKQCYSNLMLKNVVVAKDVKRMLLRLKYGAAFIQTKFQNIVYSIKFVLC